MADAPLITAFELRQIARDIADTDTPAWLIGVLNRAARTVDYWQATASANSAALGVTLS